MLTPCRYCKKPIELVGMGNRMVPRNPDGTEHEKICPEMRRAHNKKTRQRASLRNIERRGEDG